MGRRLIGMPFAALALLVAGALGACESEAPPASPSPTASTTASPTPSETPTPSTSASPDIPAAAREKSEEGAEAFARHYIERSAVAWTKPDASLLEGLATSKCATCENLYATAQQLQKSGQRYDRTPVVARAFSTFRGSDNSWVFEVELTEKRVNLVGSDGQVIKRFPERDIESAVAVVWREGQWWIDAIGE